MKYLTKFFGFFIFLFVFVLNLNTVYASTVNVTTDEQFEKALLDPAVTYINITKSFGFDKSITNVPVRELTINGNADKNITIGFDYGITFDAKDSSTNVKISLINANISPLTTNGTYNFIYKPYNSSSHSRTEFYFKDVVFNGGYLITAEKSIVTFDGNNDITSTTANADVYSIIFKAGSTYTSTSGYYYTGYDYAFDINYTSDKGWGNVTLEDGAKVYLNLGRAYYEGMARNFSEMNVKSNALLDINTIGTGISVDWDATLNIENGATVLIKQVDYTKVNNAQPNINTSPTNFLPMDVHGKLNVKSGSNLYILGTTVTGSSVGVLNLHGDNAELNFDNPANMDIRNLADNAPAVSSSAPITFNLPAYTLFWDKVLSEGTFDANPSAVFSNITGTGEKTNDTEFDKVFRQKNSVRIKVTDKEPAKFIVAFDVDGGSPQPDIQNVYVGSKVKEPNQAPTKQGFVFEGWFTDKSYSTKWDFNNVVTADLTLIAKWTEQSSDKYIVTFDADGGTPIPGQHIVAKGSKLSAPVDPTKDGFIFGGWYTDKTYATKWDFSMVVTSNLNLVAKWFANSTDKFTVKFDSNGGSAVKPVTNVSFGTTVKMPATPKKGDNCFSGWFTDKDFNTRWIFSKDKVYSDMTLYAKWCY